FKPRLKVPIHKSPIINHLRHCHGSELNLGAQPRLLWAGPRILLISPKPQLGSSPILLKLEPSPMPVPHCAPHSILADGFTPVVRALVLPACDPSGNAAYAQYNALSILYPQYMACVTH